MFPLLGLYSFFLLLTASISELGRNAPFENQAFLGPVPYAQWRRSDSTSNPSAAGKTQQDNNNQAQPEGSDGKQQPEQSGPAVKDTVGQP